MRWIVLLLVSGGLGICSGWFGGLPVLGGWGVPLPAAFGTVAAVASAISVLALTFKGAIWWSRARAHRRQEPERFASGPRLQRSGESRRPPATSARIETRTYLDVPFRDNSQVKRLGGRFDPAMRKWYVPGNLSATDFMRWLPGVEPATAAPLSLPPVSPKNRGPAPTDDLQDDDADEGDGADDPVSLAPPVYVAESRQRCWKCRERTPVFGVAADIVVEESPRRITETTVLSNVAEVPPELAAALAKVCPRYRMDFSKQGGERYLMNHCAGCGAKQGDFFLHEEPGGAFCPMSEEDAAAIQLRRLDVRTVCVVRAVVPIMMPNLIHECARRS